MRRSVILRVNIKFKPPEANNDRHGYNICTLYTLVKPEVLNIVLRPKSKDAQTQLDIQPLCSTKKKAPSHT
jgi:hypothetical protein